MDTLEAVARELQVEMKDLLDFQHLNDVEKPEDRVMRLLNMMDDKTKTLAIRVLRTFVS